MALARLQTSAKATVAALTVFAKALHSEFAHLTLVAQRPAV
jgi:hypothetical protein